MLQLYLSVQGDQNHLGVTLQSGEQCVNCIRAADHIFLLFSVTINNYGRKILAIIYNIWRQVLTVGQMSKLDDYLNQLSATVYLLYVQLPSISGRCHSATWRRDMSWWRRSTLCTVRSSVQLVWMSDLRRK
jgi:hypothetical protein